MYFLCAMELLNRLDNLHAEVKANRWMRYFTVFNRVALAAGFLPAGYVKIIGERFTDLHNFQPMGAYLEALHHTGYYYTTIGIAQILAGILLLIPRTALLGVLIYFPIILNICILSLAVRFEGSLLTSPLMVLSCIYLMCWDYDRLKFILPFGDVTRMSAPVKPQVLSNKFPWKFGLGSFAVIAMIVYLITHYDMMPRNTLKDCNARCTYRGKPGACHTFCDNIHVKGQPLSKALDEYYETLERVKKERGKQ